MDYNTFLFTQLFMSHVENNNTTYVYLEYDLIYPEILIRYEHYQQSLYYLAYKTDYQCILDYLNNEIELNTHNN